MSRKQSLLYTYPTTWVFVDDQEPFLDAVELAIPSNQPCQLWTNPNECLTHLTADRQRVESLNPTSISDPNDDILVRFELDQIAAFPTNKHRFGSVGVVVADYAMPGVTGLELFSELSDHEAKKILLTGVADEKLAVEAFNDGLIDRFVLKSDLAAMEKMFRFCSELERASFEEIQQPLVSMLPQELRSFLQSEGVFEVLSKVIAERNICEYYFSSSPLGYFCIDITGVACFVALVTDRTLGALMTTIADSDVPDETKLAVEKRKIITCLFDDLDWIGAADYDWEYNSVELTSSGGSDGLYWGLHLDPPVDVDFDSTSCSLRAYLLETSKSF